jgi:hypothetical protein
MSGASQQIVSAFEDLGLSPEDIAESQDLEVSAVKSILMQFSSVFRKAAKKEESLDFTVDEAQEAKAAIISVMRYTDDDNLKLRAARYLLDDKKGRLDNIQAHAGLNINVIQINDQMRRAIQARERARGIKAVEETKQLQEAINV